MSVTGSYKSLSRIQTKTVKIQCFYSINYNNTLLKTGKLRFRKLPLPKASDTARMKPQSTWLLVQSSFQSHIRGHRASHIHKETGTTGTTLDIGIIQRKNTCNETHTSLIARLYVQNFTHLCCVYTVTFYPRADIT